MAKYDDKIKELEDRIANTKYNKRTQHAIGLYKAQLAKLKESREARSSSGGNPLSVLGDIEGMKKMKGRFVQVELKTDRQEGDIAGTKCKKILDFFVRELERKQQVVLVKEFDYDGGQDAQGYLVVVEKPEIECRGPSTGLEEASNAFLKAKGKNVFERKKFGGIRKKLLLRVFLL